MTMAMDKFASAPWQTRPVFISSTFKDMQAERDHLRHVVFPRLEEELRKGRLLLEPIDLRQGVETADLASEEAREQLVLKVCLEEINRSQPFLIVLLGDRYGWVPPEERMKDATQEVGFDADVHDKSVTAMEIEFGILKQSPEQRRRSFFYFRDPLPYDQMPEELRADFNDKYVTDSQTIARHGRLEELKVSLAADPELKSRVHHYHVNWDASTNKVAGLEVWGEMVYQHLKQELQDEIAAAASQPPQTWEDQERVALAEFIEHRRRDFTGRQQLLDDLTNLARSESLPGAVFAIASGVMWGACVTGDPGSGKSAIFAELAARLIADSSTLLLTNAAGATPRGSQVEAMLERFIEELAATLGIDNPLPEKATPDDVDATFASLLSRVAGKRRVVLLLDALNQFDATPRAQHLTWLRPKQWPCNARLIATGLVGVPTEALSQWAGIEELEVPPLTITDDDTDDVTAIAQSVWRRYHRQVNPAVLRALKDKRLPDGSFAASNPLWLTLALEQINLLDADDFARAERDFTHLPGASERLRAMLINTAERMPPTVPDLYGWLLAQSEKVFGVAVSRSFAAVIAISRFGWRESDLLKLIPCAARLLCPAEPKFKLDDLQLAALRRSFRVHIARRGMLEKLDFFHAQMREAVANNSLKTPELTTSLHRAIADHLETLPAEDPLHISEMMFHLIAGDDAARAARLYANLQIDSTALRSATYALASHVVQSSGDGNIAWVCGLIAQQGLTNVERAHLSEHFNVDLHNALVDSVPANVLHSLSMSALSTLMDLTRLEPDNCEWLYGLSNSFHRLGELSMTMMDIVSARRHFENMLRILPRLMKSSPQLAAEQGVIALDKLGHIASQMGDLNEAKRMTDSNLRATKHLAEMLPDVISLQRNYSFALIAAGDLAQEIEDLTEARRLYGEALRIRQRLVSAGPFDAESQRECFVSLHRVGLIEMKQLKFAEAACLFDNALQVVEALTNADPNNIRWQGDLSQVHFDLGKLAGMQNDTTRAERHLQTAINIEQDLVYRFPENLELQRRLSVSLGNLGEQARVRGDLNVAQELLGRSRALSEHLCKIAPDNPTQQTDLVVVHQKLAFLAWDNGDTTGYETELHACFQLMRRMVRRGQQLNPQISEFHQQLSGMFDDDDSM